ncbi:unnamed protein product [Calypogeia fissa]
MVSLKPLEITKSQWEPRLKLDLEKNNGFIAAPGQLELKCEVEFYIRRPTRKIEIELTAMVVGPSIEQHDREGRRERQEVATAPRRGSCRSAQEKLGPAWWNRKNNDGVTGGGKTRRPTLTREGWGVDKVTFEYGRGR